MIGLITRPPSSAFFVQPNIGKSNSRAEKSKPKERFVR